MMDDKYMYRNNMYMLINTKAYFHRSSVFLHFGQQFCYVK